MNFEGLVEKLFRFFVIFINNFSQFKQGERTPPLRFKKVKNEINQCFETFDEENMPQGEIFERLVRWLEDQTDCHNRDALEAMISFFVQNCEVFNETPE